MVNVHHHKQLLSSVGKLVPTKCSVKFEELVLFSTKDGKPDQLVLNIHSYFQSVGTCKPKLVEMRSIDVQLWPRGASEFQQLSGTTVLPRQHNMLHPGGIYQNWPLVWSGFLRPLRKHNSDFYLTLRHTKETFFCRFQRWVPEFYHMVHLIS